MTNTIELTPKTTKWIFIINGIINSGLGIYLRYSIGISWTANDNLWTNFIQLDKQTDTKS